MPTPGGTFKVPDQISVLNKYETIASTHVYKTQQDEDSEISSHASLSFSSFWTGSFRHVSPLRRVPMRKLHSMSLMLVRLCNSLMHWWCWCSVAARSSSGEQSSKETHKADRKIDATLYTLHSSPEDLELDPELLSDAAALPTRFSMAPHLYLALLRKWGRYVPAAASFGGTVVIEMSFETASADTSWSHGVEAQFDSIVSGRMGSETNGRQASLAANSEISLLANGGVFVDADD